MITKFVSLSAYLAVCFGAQFQILNKDGGDIWVGIQGNPGHTNLAGGGFVLKSGQQVTINAEDNWAGRFWPRTWCDTTTNHCATGDCGNKLQCNGAGGTPPASLAEITLRGSGGLDYYDVSLVDGFNALVAIEPIGGTGDGSAYSCKKAACQAYINDGCPAQLQVKNSQGVIACNSACNAFNTDQYCCRGAYGTPATCNPNNWAVNSAKYFKDRCPGAYSYAYDDQKSTFTCKAGTYKITLGG